MDYAEELKKTVDVLKRGTDTIVDALSQRICEQDDSIKAAAEKIDRLERLIAEMGGLKVWIDDVRNAPEGFIWIKSTDDFIDLVEFIGANSISLIDTDHDAGEYQKFGGDYIKCFDYLELIGAKNVRIHIHSGNPVGVANIRRIIFKNSETNNWTETF